MDFLFICVTVLIDFLHTYMIVYVLIMDLLAKTSAVAIAPHAMVHLHRRLSPPRHSYYASQQWFTTVLIVSSANLFFKNAFSSRLTKNSVQDRITMLVSHLLQTKFDILLSPQGINFSNSI
jgi:hypothetical protein